LPLSALTSSAVHALADIGADGPDELSLGICNTANGRPDAALPREESFAWSSLVRVIDEEKTLDLPIDDVVDYHGLEDTKMSRELIPQSAVS